MLAAPNQPQFANKHKQWATRSVAAVTTSPFPLHATGARSSCRICHESSSSVDSIHPPAPGTWLLSLSGERAPSLSFSFKRLTVVKLWSSSSMRCARPKESSRPFQPVSSQSPPSQLSPPARVPGRNNEGTTGGETTTENDIQTSISISFRSDFATVLRAPCYDGEVLRDKRFFTIDTTTASGQPVRFFQSGADDDGDSAGLASPSPYPIVLRPRSSPPLLESDSIE